MTRQQLDILALTLIILVLGWSVWRWRSASKRYHVSKSRFGLFGFLAGLAGFLLFLGMTSLIFKYDYFEVIFPFVGYNQVRFSVTLTILSLVFMIATCEVLLIFALRNKLKITSEDEISSIGNNDIP